MIELIILFYLFFSAVSPVVRGQETEDWHKIVIKDAMEQDVVVIAARFAAEYKQLSDQKWEVVTDCVVVKSLKGGMQFGHKFRIVAYAETELKPEPFKSTGDFDIFVFRKAPSKLEPMEPVIAVVLDKIILKKLCDKLKVILP